MLGDAKYGQPEYGAVMGRMYLHALRIQLPKSRVFSCLPDWPGERALHAMPASLALSGAEYPQVPEAGLPFEQV